MKHYSPLPYVPPDNIYRDDKHIAKGFGYLSLEARKRMEELDAIPRRIEGQPWCCAVPVTAKSVCTIEREVFRLLTLARGVVPYWWTVKKDGDGRWRVVAPVQASAEDRTTVLRDVAHIITGATSFDEVAVVDGNPANLHRANLRLELGRYAAEDPHDRLQVHKVQTSRGLGNTFFDLP